MLTISDSGDFAGEQDILDAVTGMPWLEQMYVRVREGSLVPSILPALEAAHSAGRLFELTISTPSLKEELSAIKEEWRLHSLGGFTNVVLKVAYDDEY